MSKKTVRNKFRSQRPRMEIRNRMKREEFWDRNERNARFNFLRERGTRHVNKYSTVRDSRSLWIVVYPLN